MSSVRSSIAGSVVDSPSARAMPEAGSPARPFGSSHLLNAPAPVQQLSLPPPRVSENYAVHDDATYSQPVPKPDGRDIGEIVGLLKVKNSMLALGACERVKKIARFHAHDVINSPIMPELVAIISEGPGTPLAGAAMSALSTMALVPEGRQKICMVGGAVSLIKLISRADPGINNVDKAASLLMNLAADQHNRKLIRDAGGVEALVNMMRVAGLDPVLEHCMGALHNVMLTDSKAKARAVDGGIAYALARILAARLDEAHMVSVRARMLISDLLRVPDMQERLEAAATEMGIKLPGMAGYGRLGTADSMGSTSVSRRGTDNSGTGRQQPGVSEAGMQPIGEGEGEGAEGQHEAEDEEGGEDGADGGPE